MAKSKISDAEKRQRALLRASIRLAHAPREREFDDAAGDDELFRLMLARRIETLAGTWRRCRDPACRRIKGCAGPTMRCRRDFPSPPMTREQQAAAIADFQKQLKARIAELGLDNA